MPTIESIQADIDEAVTPGFRGRLIARGQARAIIWRDGVMPAGAPGFSPQLSYDLHSYGYSLLELGLRLLELGGDPARARLAFEQAATALEAVMSKGARGEADRDFHFVMAAAAYHLAHLAARAYSLLIIVRAEDNFSPIERVLAHLMLRDLGALKTTILDFRLQGAGSDATITAGLQARWDQAEAGGEATDGESSFLLDGVDLALTDSFFGALATFLLAIERGDRTLMEQAVARLREGLGICSEVNLIP